MMRAMFVHTIVRTRGPDPAGAAVAAHRFLHAAGDANNAFALLLVCSFPADVRTVLVDKSDFRRRDRQAAELRRQLSTRDEMIRYAKRIRFQELFLMLGATRSRHERAIYESLRGEYLASVDSPAQEEVFLRATDGIVREVLTLTMEDATRYLASRAETAQRLLEHSTDRSFPFVEATGLDLYQARLFDLGGDGDETYVIASVHV
jgi:hypothetical protein